MGRKPLKPSKVVHLITLLELGGAQGNTLYTVRHLDPDLFETTLWAGPGAYWDQAAKSDLGKLGRLRFFNRLVRPINPLYDFIVIFDLWRAFRSEKPTIVHTHSSKAGILGRLAAHLAGVPIIIHTFHGFGFNDQQNFLVRGLFIWLEKWVAQYSTALIFVSKPNQETATQLKIGDPSKYHLIRSGIPIEAILRRASAADRNEVRRSLGIPNAAPLVTSIGPFKPQKNLGDFIRAAHVIHNELPGAHFLVVGDGAERTFLENQIKEAGLNEVFHLPGWREDIPEILAASSIFVLSSLWEGLPRSLVEALLVGLPAVCYDTDGIRDVLPDEECLVKQGDFALLAQKAIALLKQPKNTGKDLIDDDFDIDKMVTQQADLYQTLLDKPRRIN